MIPTEYNVAEAWTRQPCDTDARWRVFQGYRDMALPRSLARLAVSLSAQPSTIESWSWQDGWVARCFEFDRWIDSVRVETMLELMNEDARARGARHVSLLRDMQEGAAIAARAWLAEFRNEPTKALQWSPNEIARMVKTAITLERLVHGESTENVDNKHGFDLSRLSIEEIETMRVLEAKASE